MSDTVNVWTPSNEAAHIPAEQLDAALAQGFRPMQPHEVQFERAKQEASGVAGGAIAGGAALANTLSFGAFRPLVKHFDPQSEQAIEASEAAHPVISGAGTVAGLAASIPSAVTKGIAEAGSAVGGRIANPILSRAAQFGTEGLLAAAPKATAEAVTGDTDEAAETLLGSGLATAGIGAALGGGEMALDAVSPYISAAQKRFVRTAQNVGDSATFKALGGSKLIKGQLQRQGFTDGDFADFMQWARDNDFVKIFSDPNDLKSAALTFKQQSGQKIGAIMQNVDALGGDFIDSGKLYNDVQQLGASIPKMRLASAQRRNFQKALSDVEDLLVEQAPGALGPDEIAQVTKEYGEETASKLLAQQQGQQGLKPLSFVDAYKLKSALADAAYDAKTGASKTSGKIYGQLERIVNGAIEDGLENAESQIPDQVALWKEAKQNYRFSNAIQKPLNNLINSQGNQAIRLGDYGGMAIGGGLGGVPGAVMGGIVNHIRQEYGASASALLIQRALKAGKSMSAQLSELSQQALLPYAGQARVAGVGTLEALTGEDDRNDAMDKVLGSLSNFVQDPQTQAATLDKTTGYLSQADPAVAGAAHQKLLQAATTLLQNAPKKDAATPFEQAGRYSDKEITDFERKLNVVLDPMGAMRDLQHGTLDPGSVGVLQSVYPQLYGKMLASLTENASAQPRNYSFGQKLNLSLMYQKEVDSVATPDKMHTFQAQFAPQPVQPQKKKLKLNENYQTENQRIEGR